MKDSTLWQAAQRVRYPVDITKVATQNASANARSNTVDGMVDYLLGVPTEKEFDEMGGYQTVNPALLGLAETNVARFAKTPNEKRGFVMGGDPMMAGGGDPMAGGGGAPPPGGPPPGGDPMAGGGGPPPGGPPPGGDPMMGGGPPPGGDPMMGGGGGGDPMAALQPMIQQIVQQAMAAQGGAGGPTGAAPGLKPKIDINVEIMQVKKLLAKLCDAMGVAIPAADMVATPEDLNQIAEGGAGNAAMTPDGGGGGGGPSAIKPIAPMGAAMPMGGDGAKMAVDRHQQQGTAYSNPFGEITNRAYAILEIQKYKK